MMYILREMDHLLLSIPLMACAGFGAVGGLLEQAPYTPVKASGWLISRTAIVLGVVTGIPLLVYSLSKLTFAKILNSVTFNRFESLKSFEQHAELQFTVTLVAVSTLPLIIFAIPHVIRAGFKAYQTYKEYQAVYNEFTESELFKTLSQLYVQINQALHPQQPELLAKNVE